MPPKSKKQGSSPTFTNQAIIPMVTPIMSAAASATINGPTGSAATWQPQATPQKERTEHWRDETLASGADAPPQSDDDALAQAAGGLTLKDPSAGTSRTGQRSKAQAKTKTSEVRTLNLCSIGKNQVLRYGVPIYASWSEKNPTSNKYKFFYTYCTKYQFTLLQPLLWNWQFKTLEKGNDGRTQLIPVDGFTYAKPVFATEHIFEIQILAQFIMKVAAGPQAKAIQKLLTDPAFIYTAQGLVPYTSRPGLKAEKLSPLSILASALPAKDDEFIYLQEELNGIKATYFGGKTPEVLQNRRTDISKMSDASIVTRLEEVLSAIALTALLAQYMNTPNVSRVYLAVRGRIGKVLTDLAAEPQIKRLNLATEWTKWHNEFITTVESNMQKSVNVGIAIVESIIRQVPQRQAATLTTKPTRQQPVRNQAAKEAAATAAAESKKWLEGEMPKLSKTLEHQKRDMRLGNINLQELVKVLDEPAANIAAELTKVKVFDEKDWGDVSDEEYDEGNDDSMVANASFDPEDV